MKTKVSYHLRSVCIGAPFDGVRIAFVANSDGNFVANSDGRISFTEHLYYDMPVNLACMI